MKLDLHSLGYPFGLLIEKFIKTLSEFIISQERSIIKTQNRLRIPKWQVGSKRKVISGWTNINWMHLDCSLFQVHYTITSPFIIRNNCLRRANERNVLVI